MTIFPILQIGKYIRFFVSITSVNKLCNVNILLEAKGILSDFLKHLKESICKLGLDFILTDFFLISLTLLVWLLLQWDYCKSAATGIRSANFGHLKKNLNLRVILLFHKILYHVSFNSMKSCIIILSEQFGLAVVLVFLQKTGGR